MTNTQASKTAGEQLRSQMNVEESTQTTSSTWTNQRITDSPLFIIGDDEQGYAVTLGKYRITPIYQTKEEAYLMGTNPNITTIISLIATMIEANEELNHTPIKPTKNKIKNQIDETLTELRKNQGFTTEEKELHTQNNQRHIKDALNDYND